MIEFRHRIIIKGKKLNYDKDKFENIIFTLDDDYDTLSDFISKLNPKLSIHKELYELSDKILTKLVKLQNELGLIIEYNENKKIANEC